MLVLARLVVLWTSQEILKVQGGFEDFQISQTPVVLKILTYVYIQNFIKEHHIVPAVGDGLSVVLMASVGEVHPGNVHSRVDHFEEEFWGSGHRTDSADDSGQSNVGGTAEDSKG